MKWVKPHHLHPSLTTRQVSSSFFCRPINKMLMTGFRRAMPLKNLMTNYFIVKGCQKDFTAGKERQLINITLHVASTSLKLYSQRWHSGSLERSVSINPAFNWFWTLNIKKKAQTMPCSSQQDSLLKIDYREWRKHTEGNKESGRET